MPEQLTVIQDTLPLNEQDQVTNETDGSAPGKTETTPAKLFLGKYRTEEELEKGIHEERKLFGKQAEELGRLRSELEMSRRQEKLEEAIAAIARNKETPKDEQADLEKYIESVSEDGMPKEAVKKLTGLYTHWMSEADRKYQSKMADLERKFGELSSRTQEEMERMTPEYQQNKFVIDKMVAGGMSLSKARELVSELMKADADAPVRLERATPPASITPTRVIQHNATPASNKFLFTQEDLEILRNEFPKATDAELKTIMADMNARRTQRIANKEPTSDSIYKRSA